MENYGFMDVVMVFSNNNPEGSMVLEDLPTNWDYFINYFRGQCR